MANSTNQSSMTALLCGAATTVPGFVLDLEFVVRGPDANVRQIRFP
jgi:hypothetical protein